MKIEYNKDGSLKKPDWMVKQKEDEDRIFEEEACVKIVRNQISMKTPLKCQLLVEPSKKLESPERILDIFRKATGRYKHMAYLSIKENDKGKYIITIISGMLRCSWCKIVREKYFSQELGVKVLNWGSCCECKGSSNKY